MLYYIIFYNILNFGHWTVDNLRSFDQKNIDWKCSICKVFVSNRFSMLVFIFDTTGDQTIWKLKIYSTK